MKIATLKDNSPNNSKDGILAVVSKDLKKVKAIPEICKSVQELTEKWGELESSVQEVYDALNSGGISSVDFDESLCESPLPRAYQWLDGSAYLTHVERVRKARGAEMPESFLTDPLMYQGGSDCFIGPRDEIALKDESFGADFEGEVAVITSDVPMGADYETASQSILFVMLVNDVTLRNLIPAELSKGFGFIHGKPPGSFSPVAVTIDELGGSWKDNKLCLPLWSFLNGKRMGDPNAGEDMNFDFAELIMHASKTRPLSAGTIIGSGTVSNKDLCTGVSCLAEARMIETIESGKASTDFLKYGDTVRIEMNDASGQSIFGTIEQKIVPAR